MPVLFHFCLSKHQSHRDSVRKSDIIALNANIFRPIHSNMMDYCFDALCTCQWQRYHKLNILQCLWHMFHTSKKTCSCHKNLRYVANTCQFCAWHMILTIAKYVSRMFQVREEKFGVWHIDKCKERWCHYIMWRTFWEENRKENYRALRCFARQWVC